MKGQESSEKRPEVHRNPHSTFGRGRGRSGIPPPHFLSVVKQETFNGIEIILPVLNYGGPHKDNRPIEFMASVGEYIGVKYKSTIAPAFWNIPPAFDAYETEPIAPMQIDNQPTFTTIIQEYLHVKKHWIHVQNDTVEQRPFPSQWQSNLVILLKIRKGFARGGQTFAWQQTNQAFSFAQGLKTVN